MEDARIIELYFARNESAIQCTIEKYGAYCLAVARRILNSAEDAEECTSDTWMQAWQAIPPAKPVFLRAFLAKITRNLAINRFHAARAQKRGSGETDLVLEELSEVIGDAKSVEDEVITRELRSILDAFVRTLPEREGNLFIRRYFFTESVKEIAKRYGLKEGNVSVILNRTRGKLKDVLKDAGYAV
ncbi:MAG: sigma-70 family RNA polymerase sigma factor [Lachnospiraceae bacterium]|nr:sigma-70 family RNA polymerase sigma factor [Lachnospiraceae bacterium]